MLLCRLTSPQDCPRNQSGIIGGLSEFPALNIQSPVVQHNPWWPPHTAPPSSTFTDVGDSSNVAYHAFEQLRRTCTDPAAGRVSQSTTDTHIPCTEETLWNAHSDALSPYTSNLLPLESQEIMSENTVENFQVQEQSNSHRFTFTAEETVSLSLLLDRMIRNRSTRQ